MSKEFKRQDWHKKKKLGTSWRKPRGFQSKIRKSKGGKPSLVKIGRKNKQESNTIRIDSYSQFQRELTKIKKENLVLIISGKLGLAPKIKILEEVIKSKLIVENMRKPEVVLARLNKKVEDKKKKKEELKKRKDKKEKEAKKKETKKAEKKEESEEMTAEEKKDEDKREKDRMLISTN